MTLSSYVGTLHEISSENSTVALEQVVSYGTEGRRPDDEVPASDNVYEYIVFRGGDVKDLRIEDQPKENSPPAPPPIPNDPAILGVSHTHVREQNAKPLHKVFALNDEAYRMLKIIHFSESANPMWRFPLPSF